MPCDSVFTGLASCDRSASTSRDICWGSNGRMIIRFAVIRRRGTPLRGDGRNGMLTALFLSLHSSPSLLLFLIFATSSPRQLGSLKSQPPCPASLGCGALSVIAYRLSRRLNLRLLQHHVTSLPRNHIHSRVGCSGQIPRRAFATCVSS